MIKNEAKEIKAMKEIAKKNGAPAEEAPAEEAPKADDAE